MATSRLPKGIAGIPALPEEFTQAAKYLEPRFEELKLQEEKLQPMREQKRKEEGNILREETQALIGQKQAGVKASEEKFAEEKGLVEKAEKSIAANPLPEHTPTKEDLSTYAQMGSLMMTLGLMLGGPKGNAKAGLDAMTGMMNGWRQGRKDLWAQEAINFEKSFQKVKSEQDAIYKNLVEGRKLAATKAESAKEKYQAAAFMSGANSITAHRISVGDIDGAIKNVESSYKLRNDLQDKVYGMASSLAQNRMQKEFLAQQIAGAKAKSQEKTSGAAAGAVERMTQAMSQVSGAVSSLAALPITTTGTVFGPSDFKGLFTVPLSALNNKVSDETAQMLRTRLVGVSRGLAALETGGAATGLVGLTQKIEQGIDIAAGTPVRVALDKLAEMRRIVEDSARAALKSNKYTDSQKELIKENVQIVEHAIPFTQQDVLDSYLSSQGKALRIPKKDKNMSFTDFVKTYGLGKPKEPLMPVSEPAAAAAPATPAPAAAPATQRARIGNRAIVVKNNKWVYEDTGEDAK
jgi:hypothetical protein